MKAADVLVGTCHGVNLRGRATTHWSTTLERRDSARVTDLRGDLGPAGRAICSACTRRDSLQQASRASRRHVVNPDRDALHAAKRVNAPSSTGAETVRMNCSREALAVPPTGNGRRPGKAAAVQLRASCGGRPGGVRRVHDLELKGHGPVSEGSRGAVAGVDAPVKR